MTKEDDLNTTLATEREREFRMTVSAKVTDATPS